MEFDIDPAEAVWLDDWRRSGGVTRRRRLPSSSSVGEMGGGIKALRLPGKVNMSPRFLRELDVNRSRGSFDSDDRNRDGIEDELEDGDSHGFGPTPDTTVSHEFDEGDVRGMFASAGRREFEELKVGGGGQRGLEANVEGRGMISASASLGEMSADGESEVEAGGDEAKKYLGARENAEADALLASPIELGLVDEVERLDDLGQLKALDEGDRLKVRRLIDEKRASGLVMSEQLDDLEKSEYGSPTSFKDSLTFTRKATRSRADVFV